MSEELHITSLVVHAVTSSVAQVIEAIAALPDAQVHGVDAARGKLVVTLEAATSAAILDQIELIRQAPGVLTVAMVYQHTESLETLSTEINHVD
ncbi:chaperone NapD [Roseateles sp. PN1]|uniref:chaperone NapD n=1 Tax=Roseateles sp. PN1 TaxID=3137372 RepID=UPI003138EE9A